MKAKVVIEKSFDEGQEFGKAWMPNDFAEFFRDEGEYLDRLCDIMEGKGDEKDSFTVTYTVTVIK